MRTLRRSPFALAVLLSLVVAAGTVYFFPMRHTVASPQPTPSVEFHQFQTAVLNLPLPEPPASIDWSSLSPIEWQGPLEIFPLPKKRPAIQLLLLAEAEKALGKGPRELGTLRSLWCADFLNKTLKKLGLRGTNSNLAESFKRYAKAADGPCVGCIAVKHRGHGGGHVVVIKAVKGDSIVAISGNSRGKVREVHYSTHEFYAFRTLS